MTNRPTPEIKLSKEGATKLIQALLKMSNDSGLDFTQIIMLQKIVADYSKIANWEAK